MKIQGQSPSISEPLPPNNLLFIRVNILDSFFQQLLLSSTKINLKFTKRQRLTLIIKVRKTLNALTPDFALLVCPLSWLFTLMQQTDVFQQFLHFVTFFNLHFILVSLLLPSWFLLLFSRHVAVKLWFGVVRFSNWLIRFLGLALTLVSTVIVTGQGLLLFCS
jgi:hypothetical protein